MLQRASFLPRVALAAFVTLALAWPAHSQSLGDLARKERERKKMSGGGSGKTLNNEEIEKPFYAEYPTVQARFSMPKGWEKPVPAKNIVIAPCPGAGPLPQKSLEPEHLPCALAVGIDGPSRRVRQSPALALDRMQEELLSKSTRQIKPWRQRQLGGMQARETVVEWNARGETRRIRMVVAAEPTSGLVYMAAIISAPERFEQFAAALDTVLDTFEAAPHPPQTVPIR